jgi:hypothetical protein
VTAIINKDWLNELPPFLSVNRVAAIFDQPELTVRRWVKDPDHILHGEKLENGRWVTPRERVVEFANKLYGRLEKEDAGDAPEVHGGAGCGTRDGLDRSGDVRTST